MVFDIIAVIGVVFSIIFFVFCNPPELKEELKEKESDKK